MAAAGHTFPNFNQVLTSKTGFTALNASTKIGCALIASGTLAWNSTSQAQTTMAGLLASGSGSGALTEVNTSGTGYTRQTLGSVVCSTTGLVTTLTSAAVTLTASTFSALFAVFFDFSAVGIGSANDSSNILIAYQDFGGAEADSAGTWTFTPNASGLATWTAS